ncbi:DUF4870 domain-containing protein [Salimicrobium halophilum]|uniref:DUF4870 domain-containing protein n=1 Tax=Salimicrobium halophilum TaxID=86666 RepID=A0A1G8RL77_9BACI|nr:DUF4870 domain-containing protein [Salimicrobium halophilum]SDJ17275.1 hypothetical protein SAMN04490247_1081 [Salimicrobium halophilum]
MPTNDERLFAMLIYLISLFFPVLGPLIIWLIKREESPFVDYHGKEYLNFFLSYTIYTIISGILVLLLVGIILLIVVGIAAFIFTIIAMVKAYGGEEYRFPLVIHFIK